MQEDEKVLDKLLECSPAFIGRFCAEKTELAATSKIAYLKDFECFIKWLTVNQLLIMGSEVSTTIFLNNLSKNDIELYVQHLKNEGKKSMKPKFTH